MTTQAKNLVNKIKTAKSIELAVEKSKYNITPQLADELGNSYQDSSTKRFQVDGDGITYVHDLINDHKRNCIWGTTRKDGGLENYCFRMDRDGSITKTSIGTNGWGKGMHMTWGEGYIWISDINKKDDEPGKLIRVDPDTLVVKTYSLPSGLNGACGLTYDDGFILISEHSLSSDSKIFKFNCSSETFVDTFTISDTIQFYWALFDGSFSWFAGEGATTGTAVLVKIDGDGNNSVYDLGYGTTGSEITFDGDNIYYGSNTPADEFMLKFNIADETVEKIILKYSPRLVGFDGKLIWAVGDNYVYTRLDNITYSTETPINLSGLDYSHGLCFDGLNAWVGTWQDTCYIYRIPQKYFSPLNFSFFSFGAGGTVYGGASGTNIKFVDSIDFSDTESQTQIQFSDTVYVKAIHFYIKSNTLNSAFGVALRKNGADFGGGVATDAEVTGIQTRDYTTYQKFSTGDKLSIRFYAGSGATGNAVIGRISIELALVARRNN